MYFGSGRAPGAPLGRRTRAPGLEAMMSTRATGTFKIDGWDEEPYDEIEGGRRLTQASVKQTFAGDVEGEGAVEWLMCYRPDQTADFVGLQRIVGQIGGRPGSFVLLQTEGTFDGKVARGRLSVVPGSGTGELDGLRGGGEFIAPHGGEPSLSLDYDFE
jgi:Protein of unknown function (DUF3224)